jgi:hypothetical protein
MKPIHQKLNRFTLALLLAMPILGCEANQDLKDMVEQPESADTRAVARQLSLSQNAKVVAEGAGDLKFRAPQDGRVFVYDVEDSAALNVRHVRTGQVFEVRPESNQVVLDGVKVKGQEIKKDHTYRLYFEPEG